MNENLSHTVAESDLTGFAEISGDDNPIHLDEAYAQTTPFGGRIAHGMFTASLFSALLGTRLPGPGAVYMSQTLFFRAPVFVGSTIKARVEVVELIEEKQRARLRCECQVDGELVLEGEALVYVPRRDQ
ncbi:MAG: MaoC family dehydratase [Rhodobiaceae bacterium]|nr:MaoC family dehydratase [Rhodobiaceae bacterium]MCC0054881.1 MaoC family dehydratase [Rhodobiaceae bacterium]